MRLQRALGHRRPVALVLEVVADRGVVHHAGGGRDVALLDREHDVILQRLRAALDQQAVRRQPGRADPESGPPDHILDRIRHAVLALDLGDRVQIRRERLLDRGPLAVLEPPHARPGGEVPLGPLHRRGRLQQRHASLQSRLQEHVVQHALGVLQGEPELAVAIAGGERPHLIHVRPRITRDHPLDRLVRQRLGEAQQSQAGRHPPQVPGEVPEVGLVEVVDVEHEDPGRVHVGAEVLGVQIALDPDAARPRIGPRVLQPRDVGVEQRRAAAVERERRRRHLAELAPERPLVGLDQVTERVGEHLDDLLAALVGVAGELGGLSGPLSHAMDRCMRCARRASATPPTTASANAPCVT